MRNRILLIALAACFTLGAPLALAGSTLPVPDSPVAIGTWPTPEEPAPRIYFGVTSMRTFWGLPLVLF